MRPRALHANSEPEATKERIASYSKPRPRRLTSNGVEVDVKRIAFAIAQVDPLAPARRRQIDELRRLPPATAFPGNFGLVATFRRVLRDRELLQLESGVLR